MNSRKFSILAAAAAICSIASAQNKAAAPAADAGNGIIIGKVKVYDDQALQQALNSAQSQLAAIQAINGSALSAQIGTLQGAALSQSAFAFTAGTPPTPGIQTTANTGNTTTTGSSGLNGVTNSGNTVTTTATGSNLQTTNGAGTTSSTAPGSGGSAPQTTTGATTTTQTQNTTSGSTNLQVTGPSTQATTTSSNQTSTVGPGVQTVTTQAANTATAPTITPSTLTLPGQYSPGASAVLNEQLELTYEITGYELLLEGALSDHYLRYKPSNDTDSQLVRPRVTIGIPVTIKPRKGDENAVAEIIVEVTPTSPVVANEPPIVTAIMPRDKTYNVAAITDKSISVGGAVATQVISLGVSALWGHKSNYVVQDQDTVAFQLPTATASTARFGWIIKPVLGQSVITSGMRNCFVQLAFPELPGAPSYGTIKVTTHWKKYDAKHGVVIDESPEHARAEAAVGPFDIENLSIKPLIRNATYEDNADGTIRVTADGDFLSGTFAQVGTSSFVPNVNGTVKDPSGIHFVLPAIQLATHDANMIDRSGEASPMVNIKVATLHKNDACVSIVVPPNGKSVEAEPAGAGLTKLTVHIQIANNEKCVSNGGNADTKGKDLMVVVGNQVFGLRNLPFLTVSDSQLVFLVPTSLVQNSRRVVVKRLLWGPAFEDGADLPDTFKSTPVVGQATVVAQTKDLLEIALTGTGLGDLKALLPSKLSWVTQKDFGAIFSVAKSDVKDLKQLVLQDTAGELFLVALPAEPAPPAAPALDPVNKGTAKIVIPAGGQDLETLTDALYERKSLHPQVAADRKSVTVDASEVTKTAGTKTVTFLFSNGKTVDYSITVVDLKVESIPAPAAAH
jgi:hypothetical protein